jgi:ATP-dependent Clp protease ATP-binding subunit ClpA
MRRYIERRVEDKLANVILDNYHNNITGISLLVNEDEIKVEYI